MEIQILTIIILSVLKENRKTKQHIKIIILSKIRSMFTPLTCMFFNRYIKYTLINKMNQVKGRLKMKSYMTNVMLSDIKSHYTEEENNIIIGHA